MAAAGSRQFSRNGGRAPSAGVADSVLTAIRGDANAARGFRTSACNGVAKGPGKTTKCESRFCQSKEELTAKTWSGRQLGSSSSSKRRPTTSKPAVDRPNEWKCFPRGKVVDKAHTCGTRFCCVQTNRPTTFEGLNKKTLSEPHTRSTTSKPNDIWSSYTNMPVGLELPPAQQTSDGETATDAKAARPVSAVDDFPELPKADGSTKTDDGSSLSAQMTAAAVAGYLDALRTRVRSSVHKCKAFVDKMLGK